MKTRWSFLAGVVWTVVFLVMVPGFSRNRSAEEKMPQKPSLKDVLKWRMIGPHRGGRVVAVAGHPQQREVFYFGAAGGGVWKTRDGGEHWANISDGFFRTGSIGAIAVSDWNPSVLYAGTGECCPRGNVSHGDGMYVSRNGGRTWVHAGLPDSRHIARIVIHPRDENTVYAAVLGHLFGPHSQRGIFKTTDGGKTWRRVLFRNDTTGGIDLVMNPADPRELVAALWQVQRFPWGFESGGEGSGLFKTTDGGATWKEISGHRGLPDGIIGRCGLAVSPSLPDRLWAIVEARDKALYRSDDRGETWTAVSKKPDLFQRPWYYHHLSADPQDPDTLYVMNVGLWKSTDGGQRFVRIPTPHSDNHALWIDSRDPKRMIEGNDGGATVSYDGGATWSSIYNQPTAQFYHVTADRQVPYRVYGAQQDNSTLSLPSRSYRGQIARDSWYPVGGCESGYIAVHPENPDLVFAGCYDGMLTRYHHDIQATYDVSVWPENPMGAGAVDLKYRFQWTFPIHLSPHDPGILFAAGNRLFKSSTRGRSWETISPDLTRNDPEKQKPSGGPLTGDNTSVEYYCTIFSFAQSPVEEKVLWTGSDDGLIHLSADGGKNWREVTPPQLPPWSLISMIEASRFDAGTAYVAATRYKLDDFRPFLFRTTDFGDSWTRITGGILEEDFTRVIREDPSDRNLLFAGTETGIYYSPDRGTRWHRLESDFPVTPVHDLMIHRDDLIVATHGRSFWILDHLEKFRQWLSLKPAPEPVFFSPGNTVRRDGWFSSFGEGGQSLPPGVIFDYFLPSVPPDSSLSIALKDRNGTVIRRFEGRPGGDRKDPGSLPLKPGMNRFVWDFRLKGATKVPGAVFWFAWGEVAPKAVPGEYSAVLEFNGETITRDFTLRKDPRLNLSDRDYREQFDLLQKITDKLSQTHQTVNDIRDLRIQIKSLTDRMETEEAGEVRERAAGIQEELTAIEEMLIQTKARVTQDLLNYPIRLNNKLAALAMVVSGNECAPTRQSLRVFESLRERVDVQLNRFRQLVETDIAALNRMIWEAEIPRIRVKEKILDLEKER